jgi:acyl carrier protein
MRFGTQGRARRPGRYVFMSAARHERSRCHCTLGSKPTKAETPGPKLTQLCCAQPLKLDRRDCMDEIYRRLAAIFHDVFEDDSITVTPELTAPDVPGWDSLSHIRLILEVQRAFGIKFAAAQTANLKNVGELAELIQAKTAAVA